MPDWSYHTLLRPLLTRALPARARARALERAGAFGASRAGAVVVELMGHMRPPDALARSAMGLAFQTPIGAGPRLSGEGALAPLVARFGVGFVEVGPVALDPAPGRTSAETIATPLTRGDRLPVPLGIRLAHAPGATADAAAKERVDLVSRLAPHAEFFTLTPSDPAQGEDWTDAELHAHVAQVQRAAAACARPLLAGISSEAPLDRAEARAEASLAAGCAGFLVSGGAVAPCAALVARLRERFGPDPVILAEGGATEPAEALAILDAGATLVTLDKGLREAGPGLPKRTNEALLHRAGNAPTAPREGGGVGWIGMFLLGLGMVVAGALAWIVAATRVVLPYDEVFLGMTRADLAAMNERFLPFLAHDRITLAGTMISIGLLYVALAGFAHRRGERWARRVVATSASVGFASFFLFLAFGYFDPLHAAVSLLLLPFLLWGLTGRAHAPPAVPAPDLANDRAWRLAHWGQLGFVGLGGGLVVAGIVIAVVGSTRVFVPEDLAFMGTSAEALRAVNERLLALTAHDRAGFGGALVSNGLAVLLTAMWGVRRGARWVWWTFLLAGAAGFAGAIGVHVAVGYLDMWHLAPAYAALAVYATSLALLRPYLAARAAPSR